MRSTRGPSRSRGGGDRRGGDPVHRAERRRRQRFEASSTTATSTATTRRRRRLRPRPPRCRSPTSWSSRTASRRAAIKELKYSKGDRVRLVVRSDVADEIHIHGYDLKQDVPAGGSVRFNFAADIEGVFEIELEERKEQIAELRVSPS